MKTPLICLFGMLTCLSASAESLVYQGDAGPGKGKHIVWIAADHEYRSEEALPAMARLMAKHYGFKCTVLFSVDDKGDILPGNSNVPGMQALDSADLMFCGMRFLDLNDEQMQPFADYIERGGPVIGVRTSTHAFKIPDAKSKFARFSFKYDGAEFKGGFGREILGETWVGHYGKNHVFSTRITPVEAEKSHPVLTGVGTMHVLSGAYEADPVKDSEILGIAQVLETMEADASPLAEKDPVPAVWVRSYRSKSGKSGRVFTTTHGASQDILDKEFRRMLVNACFWTLGMEASIDSKMPIAFVGPYDPTDFRFKGFRKHVKPADLIGWDSPILPAKD